MHFTPRTLPVTSSRPLLARTFFFIGFPQSSHITQPVSSNLNGFLMIPPNISFWRYELPGNPLSKDFSRFGLIHIGRRRNNAPPRDDRKMSGIMVGFDYRIIFQAVPIMARITQTKTSHGIPKSNAKMFSIGYTPFMCMRLTTKSRPQEISRQSAHVSSGGCFLLFSRKKNQTCDANDSSANDAQRWQSCIY